MITQASTQVEGWDTFTELKKSQVKTILHGAILTEYLRANSAPQGLLVVNETLIFLGDATFRKDWSLIAWKCTRDWLSLIINSAKISDALLVQIHISENNLKTLIQHTVFKKKLEETNIEVNEYKDYPARSKINKLQKALKRFSRERVYPYVSDEYAKQKETQNTKRNTPNRRDTDSSSSGSESSDNDYRPRSRGDGSTGGQHNPSIKPGRGEALDGPKCTLLCSHSNSTQINICLF